MKEYTILYSADEIHAEIKKIFSEPRSNDERVAIVAYVGGDGDSYLPHPQGLRIICNPSPGGTDPDTIRRLIKRGAKVEFSDKLHMKVYWSRNRGCIITSANASTSALGVSGLKEAGVLFPPRTVDIKRLIKYAKPRAVTLSELHKLDRRNKEHKRNVRQKEQTREKARDFLEWYHSAFRSKWKLAFATDESKGDAKTVKGKTFSEYGVKQPHAWTCVGKDRVHKTDWLLSFVFTDRGISCIEWIYVDFVVKITRKEKGYYFKDWPYHAVQVHSSAHRPLPPFRLNRAFTNALCKAIKKYTPERIMNASSDLPTNRFLSYIAEAMSNR